MNASDVLWTSDDEQVAMVGIDADHRDEPCAAVSVGGQTATLTSDECRHLVEHLNVVIGFAQP